MSKTSWKADQRVWPRFLVQWYQQRGSPGVRRGFLSSGEEPPDPQQRHALHQTSTLGREESRANHAPSPGVIGSKPSSSVFTSLSGTAELAARSQRLPALQQDQAQLKRTPSLQLLARQRIPRLEEAIKHLM